MRLAIGLLALVASSAALQRVAVVTGAARGIGKGIAIELGRLGYAVYALGRSAEGRAAFTDEPWADGLSVDSTAEAVRAAGGRGEAMICDVGDEAQVAAAIERVRGAEGRLDVLCCSAYTTPPGALRAPFWTQGVPMWDACNGVGLRGVFATCCEAAPLMIETAAADRRSGAPPRPPLVVLVSSFGGKAFTFNVAYGVGKAAVDRLARDMAVQLRESGVATVSLYPGIVRTEQNLELDRQGTWAETSGGFDLAMGETPAFSGRAVGALLAMEENEMMARSGSVRTRPG